MAFDVFIVCSWLAGASYAGCGKQTGYADFAWFGSKESCEANMAQLYGLRRTDLPATYVVKCEPYKNPKR